MSVRNAIDLERAATDLSRMGWTLVPPVSGDERLEVAATRLESGIAGAVRHSVRLTATRVMIASTLIVGGQEIASWADAVAEPFAALLEAVPGWRGYEPGEAGGGFRIVHEGAGYVAQSEHASGPVYDVAPEEWPSSRQPARSE